LRVGEEGAEALGVEVRHRLAREIADDELAAAAGDELVGELGGLAARAEEAGIDLQGRHGRLLSEASI
jgi:hypothetical protein